MVTFKAALLRTLSPRERESVRVPLPCTECFDYTAIQWAVLNGFFNIRRT